MCQGAVTRVNSPSEDWLPLAYMLYMVCLSSTELEPEIPILKNSSKLHHKNNKMKSNRIFL